MKASDSFIIQAVADHGPLLPANASDHEYSYAAVVQQGSVPGIDRWGSLDRFWESDVAMEMGREVGWRDEGEGSFQQGQPIGLARAPVIASQNATAAAQTRDGFGTPDGVAVGALDVLSGVRR